MPNHRLRDQAFDQMRRDLLKSAALGALGLTASFLKLEDVLAQTQRAVMQGGFFYRPQFYKSYSTIDARAFTDRKVFRFDPKMSVFNSLESEVPAHVVEPHPIESFLSLAIARRSNAISLIDWKKQREVFVLKVPPPLAFYGHGAIADDGRHAVLTGYRNLPVEENVLLVINLESLKIEDTIPFPYGKNHDIVSMGGSRFAIGGMSDPQKRARLAVFDLQTRKFNPVLGPPSDGEVRFLSHLLKLDRDRVLAVASRPVEPYLNGGVIEFNVTTGTSKYVVPKEVAGVVTELFSLETTGYGSLLWFTVPEDNRVLVWDTKTAKTKSVLRFASSVKSIRATLDQQVVVIGLANQFIALDAKTLARRPDFESAWSKWNKTDQYCPHLRLATL